MLFNIDLSGGHANNYLVQNAPQALVGRLFEKYEGTFLQDTVGYDIYKTFEDLFLSKDKRNNMAFRARICVRSVLVLAKRRRQVWMRKIN